MRIGIIIGRYGDIDGVSLETEKWIDVLNKMGHEIFIISGRYTEHTQNGIKEDVLPVLSFFSPDVWERR